MNVEKENNQSPVTIEPEVKQQTTQDDSNKNSKPNASSQAQLLSIAKNFGLTGALKPIEKQAPIEERMIKRSRLEHLRKQTNLESIIEKSLKFCSDGAATHKADVDWFSKFVELAENVSNPTMQDLWGKILAGEISSPGSFSTKALQTFKNLTIHDAKLLAKACSVAVKDRSKKHIRLLSGAYQKPGLFNLLDKQRQIDVNLSHFGIGFGEILALADNNLIYAQETELPPMKKNEDIAFKFSGLPLLLTANKNDVVLQFYKFTAVGAELAQLIADKPDNETLNDIKSALSYHFSS